METIMRIHLSTEEQVLVSRTEMIIPRVGEWIKNHNNTMEQVVRINYEYHRDDILEIDVIMSQRRIE
jgi:hypothetical protein